MHRDPNVKNYSREKGEARRFLSLGLSGRPSDYPRFLTTAFTKRARRTITLGSELSSPAGAKEIDIKIKESTATMRSSAAVEEANAIKAFGYSDWKLDEPKNIPGPFAPEPDESLGRTGGTKNPSERPVSLDQSFVLKKQ